MNKYVVARQRPATDGTVCCIARSNNAIDHIILYFSFVSAFKPLSDVAEPGNFECIKRKT